MSQQSTENPARSGKRIVLALLIAVLFMVLAWRFLPSKPQQYDYLYDRAEQLEFDRERIVTFVREQIAHETYSGCLRGPVGTLWAGAGNSIDRAVLLARLLEFSERAVEIVQHDDVWSVRVLSSDGWTDVSTNPGSDPAPAMTPGEPTWTGDRLPDGLHHKLLVGVEVTRGPDKSTQTAQYRTADLTHYPLVLRFDEQGYELAPRGGDFAQALRGSCTRDGDETMTIIFAHQSPDGQSQVYRRVIYTGKYDDYEQLADQRNVHVITFATGALSRWAYEKELDLLAQDRDAVSDAPVDDVVFGYTLGLSHLVESDKALGEVTAYFKSGAWCAEPRIIIASTYYADGSGAPVGRALDLRRNVVHVEGDDAARASVAVTRSMIEGQLEGSILAKLTGQPSMTAIDVFAQFIDRRGTSTNERLAMYFDVLSRLLAEREAGATLTISLDGTNEIVMARGDDAAVHVVSISDVLKQRMEAAEVQWYALAGDAITEDQLAWAAVELESLLGPTAGSPTDYQPRIDFAESTRRLFFADSRIFTWRTVATQEQPMLTLEHQFREAAVDGDIVFEVKDYYDEVAGKPYNLVTKLRIPHKSIESSDTISSWYDQSRYDTGELCFFFSRKMYRELVDQGYTIARYSDLRRRKFEPFKLYLCERDTARIYVNNQLRDVNVLYVAGGYAKDDLPMQAYGDVEPIMDESAAQPFAINRWIVLDDPQFPMTNFADSHFQTAIPGRVVSSGTGVGIGGATVTVHDTQATGTTWGDGRFSLPIITKPFAVFRVTAQAVGYAAFEAAIDFARADAFPLSIAIDPQPAAEELLWVTAINAEAQLSKVDNPRVRDLVQQALDDDPQMIALLPTHAVPFGPAAAHAWLQFDPQNMHITSATDDGLYSASGAWQHMARRAGFGGGLPQKAVGGGISAHAGFIASWYVYSAGKLDAVSRMMEGETFDDLGHAHAMAMAAKFIEEMSALMDNFAARNAGVQAAAFKAGFAAGLAFFEANPVYRGQ